MRYACDTMLYFTNAYTCTIYIHVYRRRCNGYYKATLTTMKCFVLSGVVA